MSRTRLAHHSPTSEHSIPSTVDIGTAIRRAREAVGITQATLAERVGLPAAQTISEIELGRREVKAFEVVRIARALHIDVDVLLGVRADAAAPRVLWRRGTPTHERTCEVQLLERARRYAQLEMWCDAPPALTLPSLQFDPVAATWLTVGKLADQVRRSFDFGAIPANSLLRTLESTYGVKIFYEPLEGDASAACVRGAFGAAVLLNAVEAPWRRNFSLAHELFHLVTWDAVESAWRASGADESSEPPWFEMLERLAQSFASHLLLPAETLLAQFQSRVRDGRISYYALVGLARDLGVSTHALLVRLDNLGQIDGKQKDKVLSDIQFKRIDAESMSVHWKPLEHWYPKRFEKLAFLAYRRGVIGKAVLAQYLERPFAEIEALDLGEPHDTEAALTVN